MEPFPGTIRTRPSKNGRHKITLSRRQKEWLCEWYPLVENRVIMEASGLKSYTLIRLAKEYGLKKTEEARKEIFLRRAAKVKKICQENGYYDSLKGIPPPEKCMEGVRRMWEEINQGKRKSPYEKMRTEDPERYDSFIRQKTANRKEMIRKDMLRVKWGLPRKTKLRQVVMSKYTRSQCNFRYSARKRGYIVEKNFAEGSGLSYKIFYDENTPRSKVFERHCTEVGLRIEKWTGS